MKKSRVTVILILATLFCGCKTEKTTIEQKTEASVKYDVEEYSREKEQLREQENTNALHELFSTVSQQYTREVFSKPDSAGNQYVMERTTINTKSDIAEKSSEQTNRETDIEKSAEQAKTDKSIAKNSTQTEITEQIKVKSPFAVNFIAIALSVAGSIALMVALYFVLKRFKII